MTSQTEIIVENRKFPIQYQNGKGLSSTVKIKNGEIIIKLSRFNIGRERTKTIEKFIIWAEKKLSEVNKDDFILPRYENNGRITAHNKIYELSVFHEDREKSKVTIKDNCQIEIFLPQNLSEKQKREEIKDLTEKAIIKDQTAYLKEVLDEINQTHFQIAFSKCRFKRTQSRFGSCSAKKNINIAFRLLFAPREVFRYVCVHELAHLIEFNHSKQFWTLVEKAMPKYRQCEKWLKQKGFMLG